MSTTKRLKKAVPEALVAVAVTPTIGEISDTDDIEHDSLIIGTLLSQRVKRKAKFLQSLKLTLRNRKRKLMSLKLVFQ